MIKKPGLIERFKEFIGGKRDTMNLDNGDFATIASNTVNFVPGGGIVTGTASLIADGACGSYEKKDRKEELAETFGLMSVDELKDILPFSPFLREADKKIGALTEERATDGVLNTMGFAAGTAAATAATAAAGIGTGPLGALVVVGGMAGSMGAMKLKEMLSDRGMEDGILLSRMVAAQLADPQQEVDPAAVAAIQLLGFSGHKSEVLMQELSARTNGAYTDFVSAVSSNDPRAKQAIMDMARAHDTNIGIGVIAPDTGGMPVSEYYAKFLTDKRNSGELAGTNAYQISSWLLKCDNRLFVYPDKTLAELREYNEFNMGLMPNEPCIPGFADMPNGQTVRPTQLAAGNTQTTTHRS